MLRSALAISAFVCAAALGGACESDSTTGPPDGVRFETGFEAGLDGFSPDGTDLDDPPVEWSIERTDERAESGMWSVRLELANLNDAGKIWLERRFDGLEPGRGYDMEIAFDLASSDFGVNLWRVVAGASADDPETRDDLTFEGDTDTGAGPDTGPVWERRELSFTAEAGGDGTLWVFLGVWGTSEFTRVYFIDDVEIVLTPR